MTELLMDDEGRWQRMKEKFRDIRKRYYQLKTKLLDELQAAGLRISRRSKKIKQSVKHRKEKFVADHIDPNEIYDQYDDESFESNHTMNDTREIEEYEYDDLDSDDQTDDFESLDDIRGICDQIDWNVLNNNATVYMLSTYLIENKIVCSLSNVEEDQEYEHLCEYGRKEKDHQSRRKREMFHLFSPGFLFCKYCLWQTWTLCQYFIWF